MTRTSLIVSEALARELSQRRDEVLRAVADTAGCKVFLRGDEVVFDGADDPVEQATRMVRELGELADRGLALQIETVEAVTGAMEGDRDAREVLDDVVWRYRGTVIRPRTLNQKRYVDAIRSHTMTFGLGPAGNGKTYLAMALAVHALEEREVSRIILTRPAVEAGERLGFLPGDLMAKVDPYLRPLFDALYDMMEAERVGALLERGVVEVAPLAFMRGRTLNDAFIILDEAQNTTREQMRMFLTRLGLGSKVVVTGDPSQVDLPREQVSGLAEAGRVLRSVPAIAMIEFDRSDVVRHRLVQEIVDAYRRAEDGARDS